ncbi:MAG TPA: M20/M25/M40 family metallo-hydrolase [Azospirillaceae bacterium]|nr:M20/M25/M40 family metallo-hydrolase [Azospirillaceae bacterium]
MSRDQALDHVRRHFDGGGFLRDLKALVAVRTESQEASSLPELRRYVDAVLGPRLTAVGFELSVVENTVPGRGPFLIGRRIEDEGLPTVFTYGHGDTVRGMEGQWRDGLDPWDVTVRGDRWYGRGVADNKGQHAINLAALEAVLAVRGRLGFNVKILVEMGEECGSPGLMQVAGAHREALRADVLIGSDGPRLSADRPLVFLGTRGVMNFELSVHLRDGAHHSGNWGGLLANPGTILANAIASLVDGRGRIRVDGLRPPPAPDSVRRAVAACRPDGGKDGPTIDEDWGEPGLTPAERVYAWNALEVLAFETGNPERPANAIPPSARATLQLRHVVGTDWRRTLDHVRAHLDAHGLQGSRSGRWTSRWRPRAWIPTLLGCGSPWTPLPGPRGHRRRSFPTSAVRCPTRCSPMCWACRRCGSPTAIPAAPNTHPTSTAWPRSCARGWRS